MKKNTYKRGFTLTELAVVLAVLGIVSAMVVSFTVSINGSRQLSSARLDAMSDVGVAESFVNDFIERNEITAFTGEVTSITTKDGKTLTLDDNADGGKNLVAKIGENTETSITLTNVTDIKFESMGSGDVIYFVTVTFKVLEAEETYTFCVNPYTVEGGN